MVTVSWLSRSLAPTQLHISGTIALHNTLQCVDNARYPGVSGLLFEQSLTRDPMQRQSQPQEVSV